MIDRHSLRGMLAFQGTKDLGHASGQTSMPVQHFAHAGLVSLPLRDVQEDLQRTAPIPAESSCNILVSRGHYM